MLTAAAAQSWTRRWRQRLWRLAPADRAPIVLRHRRIYILPTRRGLALIATLAIMLLTSMNYSLSLGHALTFLVAGLVASGLAPATVKSHPMVLLPFQNRIPMPNSMGKSVTPKLLPPQKLQ